MSQHSPDSKYTLESYYSLSLHTADIYFVQGYLRVENISAVSSDAAAADNTESYSVRTDTHSARAHTHTSHTHTHITHTGSEDICVAAAADVSEWYSMRPAPCTDDNLTDIGLPLTVRLPGTNERSSTYSPPSHPPSALSLSLSIYIYIHVYIYIYIRLPLTRPLRMPLILRPPSSHSLLTLSLFSISLSLSLSLSRSRDLSLFLSLSLTHTHYTTKSSECC